MLLPTLKPIHNRLIMHAFALVCCIYASMSGEQKTLSIVDYYIIFNQSNRQLLFLYARPSCCYLKYSYLLLLIITIIIVS